MSRVRAVAERQAGALGLELHDIDDVLDYLCWIAVRHDIYYLWRPVLRDPKDDMVLEVEEVPSKGLGPEAATGRRTLTIGPTPLEALAVCSWRPVDTIRRWIATLAIPR